MWYEGPYLLVGHDRTLSGTTTPGQSGPGSNGTEGGTPHSQSSSITGASPSDCLVSYPGHSLGRILPHRRDTVSVFYSPSQLNTLLKVLLSSITLGASKISSQCFFFVMRLEFSSWNHPQSLHYHPRSKPQCTYWSFDSRWLTIWISYDCRTWSSKVKCSENYSKSGGILKSVISLGPKVSGLVSLF